MDDQEAPPWSVALAGGESGDTRSAGVFGDSNPTLQEHYEASALSHLRFRVEMVQIACKHGLKRLGQPEVLAVTEH